MEPIAGERFEVDWGHFGALDYSGDSRKLYAFALVDAHSRMMYVEFTHCQSFGTFVRCHLHAFNELGGALPMGGGPFRLSASCSFHVQLQRQSSATALADGVREHR